MIRSTGLADDGITPCVSRCVGIEETHLDGIGRRMTNDRVGGSEESEQNRMKPHDGRRRAVMLC